MSVTQMEEFQENQSVTEEKSKNFQQGKRSPPFRNTSRFWFERFLAVIQRQNPSVIDSNFASQIAPNNEGKVLSQLKFLHIIDDMGKPTDLLPMLNMVGGEQKKAFQEIAKSSYQELFSEVKISKAVPDDLVNFFIRKYSFTRDKAINAAKFFLYLAEKGSIEVSPELSLFLTEKTSPGPNQNGVSAVAVSKLARPPQREVRNTPVLVQKVSKRNTRVLSNEEQPFIQATINIKLDKDTPKEYWDRVFALLGERKVEVDVNVENKSEENEDLSE